MESSSSRPQTRRNQASRCIANSLHILPTVDHRPHKLVIGHRGASSHLPEHTLPAYRLALELGADFVEPDIVPTKDGKLIALHSVDLGVTTNVEQVFGTTRSPWYSPFAGKTGYWSFNFTYNEISQLRVKQRLPEARTLAFDNMFQVPLLEEIVELLIDWNHNALPQTMAHVTQKVKPKTHNDDSTTKKQPSGDDTDSTKKKQPFGGVSVGPSPKKKPPADEAKKKNQPFGGVTVGPSITSAEVEEVLGKDEDDLRKPSTLELAESGIYLELKEVQWVKDDANIDMIDLIFSHFETFKFQWQWLFPCYQELLYNTYRVPGLVIQSFDLYALKDFHEKWQETKDETEVPEPPLVLLADIARCESEKFWDDIGKNMREILSGVGVDKRCVISKPPEPEESNGEVTQEEEVVVPLSVTKARESNLAIHPYTERPEKTFFAWSRFDTAMEETIHLFCEVGVDGVFSESVSTAVTAAGYGCENGNDDPAFQHAGVGSGAVGPKEPPYCYDSDREVAIYVGISCFVLGLLFASMLCQCQKRSPRESVAGSSAQETEPMVRKRPHPPLHPSPNDQEQVTSSAQTRPHKAPPAGSAQKAGHKHPKPLKDEHAAKTRTSQKPSSSSAPKTPHKKHTTSSALWNFLGGGKLEEEYDNAGVSTMTNELEDCRDHARRLLKLGSVDEEQGRLSRLHQGRKHSLGAAISDKKAAAAVVSDSLAMHSSKEGTSDDDCSDSGKDKSESSSVPSLDSLHP